MIKMRKILWTGKGEAEEVSLLEELDSPKSSWLEIVQQLKNYFNLDQCTNGDDVTEKWEEAFTPAMDW